MTDDESLGLLYRAAITDIPNTGHLDPAKARTTARKRSQRRRGATAGVLVAAVLVAAFSFTPHLAHRGNLTAVPQAPPTDTQPEPAMNIDPATAGPGSVIVVNFADRYVRGVAFQLQLRQASNWHTEYYLIDGIDGINDGDPTRAWWHADDPNPEVKLRYDIAQSGPAKLRVPDDAKPGNYRLCTTDRKPTACTPLTIE